MDHRPRNQYNLWHYLLHVCRQLLRNRSATCFILLLIVTVVLVMTLSSGRTSANQASTSHIKSAPRPEDKPPMFWLYHKTEEPLSHVLNVFRRLGFVQGGQKDNWDVLWAYQYPFYNLPTEFWAKLKPHQRVNHFPGSGCFTFKPQLATMDYEFIPKAFQLPKQADKFVAEAKAHPDQLWVQKDNNHRKIKVVKSIKNVNLHSEGSFVQQFIGNPLLIDGRKFDIGVYTVITSVDPLRVYTYSGEVLVRFCSEDYEPFDVRKVKKYVVDDEYMRPSSVKSMATLLEEHSLSNKEALNVVLKRKGFAPSDMWEQVDNIIRKVLVRCESSIIKYTKKLSVPTRHFFEMVRFDFVIDDQLKVWLMEVNLSPNLSSDHFSENRHMYEQVIFNTLSLAGLVRPRSSALRYNGQFESVMMVNDRDIQVPLESCMDGSCAQCTQRQDCELCSSCRTTEHSFALKQAFLEHVNRRGFTRVYPPPIQPHSKDSTKTEDEQSRANQVMSMWYREKCRTEPSWCF